MTGHNEQTERVDVEIVTRSHALLSASSAERWLTCTPSARIEEQMPDTGSSFATDGTAAHAFAETRLRMLAGQISGPEYRAAYQATKKLHAEVVDGWTHADWDAIDSYVNYVMDQWALLGGKLLIEQRVDYSRYAEGGFGTSDAIIFAPESATIKSIDLKFGKGVQVVAYENPQAKLYALGALLNLDLDHQILNVEWAIHQPRLDYVGEGGTTVAELVTWAEEVVKPAAEKAWRGEGKLVPSAKGCRFCKAAATCRARAAENVLIARRDFAPLPDIRLDEHVMDMEEIARILPDLDQWMAWANALKAHALTQVRDKGAVIPGYKLVRGRANRAWDPNADLPAALEALGVSETDIFVSPEPSVRSVAQLEKQVGKAKFKPIAEALVIVPDGTPALVPDTDPRDAIDAVAEAKRAFEG